MTIGLSLPLGYLARTENTPAATCFSDAFGEPRDCLATLKDHGVRSIELQGFGPGAPASELLGAAQTILDSGMAMTLHAYLVPASAGHTFGDLYPQLVPTMELLRDREVATMMVVHAVTDRRLTHRAMTERTSNALERLTATIDDAGLPARVALELNRYHGIESPGATYDGLLEIAQRLGDAEVGFCWDMGHAQSSVLQNRLPNVPPPAFVGNVTHTHVHGLAPDGDTHWPLAQSWEHVADGVARLKACAYGGAYNLELYPTRWGAQTTATVRDAILDSTRCLREILDTREKGEGVQE